MKISHEVPICLLEESRVFNDYDYALVHLFEEYPKYYDFFKKSLGMGREVILDNSIFELGVAFDFEKYRQWIQKLNPTYYIVPDSLEDSRQTIQNAEKWFEFHHPGYSPGNVAKPIGVLQGKNYEELWWCLRRFRDLNIDRIAISFDYSFYQEIFPHPNKLVSWCFGRVLLINKLIEYCQNIELEIPKLHLLGCSSLLEFSLYSDETYSFIKSLDTSNPIVHGIKGIPYSLPDLLHKKPSVKLFELINEQLTPEQYKLITDNVHFFRQIIKSK